MDAAGIVFANSVHSKSATASFAKAIHTPSPAPALNIHHT